MTPGMITLSALADCLDVPEQHAEVSYKLLYNLPFSS